MFLTSSELLIIKILSFISGGMILGGIVYIYMKFKNKLLFSLDEKLEEMKEVFIELDILNELYKQHYEPNNGGINIRLHGTTNYEDMSNINYIVLEFPDKSSVNLDRDITEYYVKNGRFVMIWKHCYIWDGKEKIYLDLEKDDKSLHDAAITDIALDDEAPEDFEMFINSWKSY